MYVVRDTHSYIFIVCHLYCLITYVRRRTIVITLWLSTYYIFEYVSRRESWGIKMDIFIIIIIYISVCMWKKHRAEVVGRWQGKGTARIGDVSLQWGCDLSLSHHHAIKSFLGMNDVGKFGNCFRLTYFIMCVVGLNMYIMAHLKLFNTHLLLPSNSTWYILFPFISLEI